MNSDSKPSPGQLRPLLSAGLLALTPLSHLAAASEEAGRKPNIIFILLDDFGYADLACYGSRFYETLKKTYPKQPTFQQRCRERHGRCTNFSGNGERKTAPELDGRANVRDYPDQKK